MAREERSQAPRERTGVHALAVRVQATSDVDHWTIRSNKLLEPLSGRVVGELLKTLIFGSLACLGRVELGGADVL